MKVSELEGAELDYWVGKAEGYTPLWWGDHWFILLDKNEAYRPSTYWSVGGPIIERECIELQCGDAVTGHTWHANIAIIANCDEPSAVGPTPLIAAMRCFVASKFGETVDSTESATAP